MTEREAIDRCREGDSGGLRVLFELHRLKVYHLSWRMLGSPDDAEDAVQDVFLKAFNNIGKYRGDSSFGTWLYRMTANHCLDALRRRKVLTFLGMEDSPEPAGRMDTAHEAAKGRLSPVVEKAINRLPPRQKACLLMREMEEMSYEEIAQAMSASVGSVKSTLHRAKELLKEELERAGLTPDDL